MSDPSRRVERRLAAVLAADIAGYSGLMAADEEGTVRDLKAHQSVVLPMVASFGGRVIDPNFAVDAYLRTLHYQRDADREHHREALLRAELPA
jgi:adenylate cyclase